MASANKYAIKITQNDNVWTADITRRASRKNVIVSKSQSGFSSEAEAQAWAEVELKGFSKNQNVRNKRHNEKRSVPSSYDKKA